MQDGSSLLHRVLQLSLGCPYKEFRAHMRMKALKQARLLDKRPPECFSLLRKRAKPDSRGARLFNIITKALAAGTAPHPAAAASTAPGNAAAPGLASASGVPDEEELDSAGGSSFRKAIVSALLQLEPSAAGTLMGQDEVGCSARMLHGACDDHSCTSRQCRIQTPRSPS